MTLQVFPLRCLDEWLQTQILLRETVLVRDGESLLEIAAARVPHLLAVASRLERSGRFN